MVVEQKLKMLKDKLNKQIENNENYDVLFKTSTEIDKLIVEYYKSYGLSGIK